MAYEPAVDHGFANWPTVRDRVRPVGQVLAVHRFGVFELDQTALGAAVAERFPFITG